jgi:hypothetical protein
MEEAVEYNNTTSVARILEDGDEEYIASVSTLLGPEYRLQRGGVIRPGIMKPKNNCTDDDKAKYEAMLAEGATWDEIDRALGVDGRGKSKLVPSNVDYFSVRPRDCVNQKHAQKIHDMYADPDGKLRELPVIFPVNEWWKIIDHSLRCFGQSGIRFRSKFKEVYCNNQKDAVRVCQYPMEEAGKVFGGRKWAERPCDPDTCREYQSGECKFGGTLSFYIPGISGIGVWVLPTTSWYSLLNIKSALQYIAGVTNGQLAKLFYKDDPLFLLQKVCREISVVDPKTGKATRREQWLINLDVSVDMASLIQYYKQQQIADRAQIATATFAGRNGTANKVDCDHGRSALPVHCETEKTAAEVVKEYVDEAKKVMLSPEEQAAERAKTDPHYPARVQQKREAIRAEAVKLTNQEKLELKRKFDNRIIDALDEADLDRYMATLQDMVVQKENQGALI